ncbi:MAG: hypothetical protein LBO79_07040 [Zoogloeaceae bacterium]|jgi:hypothetical protein|nr:hypothetical protein [Zoogloeaceae bacterium]
MCTNEQKAQYVAAIAAIWPNMPNNSINNISGEVVDLMGQVLNSIRDCSQAFVAIDATFSLFYDSGSWGDILANALINGINVGDWIAALRGNMQYNVCVVTAAANWRSAIELALMGLRK